MKSGVHLYRLANDQLARWLGVMVLISAGMLIATLMLVHAEVRDYNPYSIHERFEALYMSSGGAWVYFIAVIILCGYFLVMVYADYWGSKAVYTYMTLPVRREWVYASRLLVFALCMVLLTAVQLICVRAGYGIYASHIGSYYEEGQFVMHNGLFLAHIRSPFLRLIMPVGWSGILCVASILLALVSGLYYTAICERARRRYGYLFSAAAAYGMFDLIRYVIQEDMRDFSYEKLITSCVVLLGASVYFILHSLYLIRRGAIA